MEAYIPHSIDELLQLIDNENCRIACGCTDIVVGVKAGKLAQKPIIDLNHIDEINRIYEDGKYVYIGANVTLNSILENKIVSLKFDLLAKAIKTIGSPQIRNMATLGGNIANASPSGDGILALTVLDAVLLLKSRKGERRVKISDFIKGVGKTDLKNDEFIEYIILEDKFNGYKSYFEKVGLRTSMIISVCSMALLYKISEDTIEDIKIGYGAVAPKVSEIYEAERILKGKKLKKDVLEDAASIIEKSICPIDDVRATAEYRKKVSGNLILRLLNMN